MAKNQGNQSKPAGDEAAAKEQENKQPEATNNAGDGNDSQQPENGQAPAASQSATETTQAAGDGDVDTKASAGDGQDGASSELPVADHTEHNGMRLELMSFYCLKKHRKAVQDCIDKLLTDETRAAKKATQPE